jgi:L-fuconolactonase
MNRVGVDRAVVVSTPLYGYGSRANEYTLRAIERHPQRLYGVGIVPVFRTDPTGTADCLERLVGHDRVIGVRLHAIDPPLGVPDDDRESATWLTADHLDPFYRRVIAEDSAVFVLATPDQLSAVVDLASTWPELSIVVDHMAAPEPVDPATGPWTTLQRLAERPNVAVKVSSIPRASREGWPYRDCHDHLRSLLEWFGPERLMRGSDYPWMDQWASYEECLSWLDAVECCSRRDRVALSSRTFEEWHG